MIAWMLAHEAIVWVAYAAFNVGLLTLGAWLTRDGGPLA